MASVRSVVERYLHDLRGTLETNVDEARRMLANQLLMRLHGARREEFGDQRRECCADARDLA